MQNLVGWSPHPGQRAFLGARHPIRVLACGRRWGKTEVCAADTVLAMRDDGPGSQRHIVIAPTADQAAILFDRVVELAAAQPELVFPRVTKHPHLTAQVGEHRVVARSAVIGRALRGHGATHLIVDEAAFVPEAVITEVAMPMLATTNGRLTLISTPSGRNFFWRMFRMADTDPQIWARRAPSSESPRVSPAFLDLQRRLISDRAFRTEYLAEFLDSGGQVFSSETLERCLVEELPRLPDPGIFAAGVDWGRHHDATAVVVLEGSRRGANLVHLERMVGVGWSRQIERVVELLRAWRVRNAAIDQTGIGSMPTEMVSRIADVRVHEVSFSAHLKEGLIGDLALMVETGKIKWRPCPDLHRELEFFEVEVESSGRRRYGAPPGMHDDLVIALALAVRALHPGSVGSLQVAGARLL